MSVTNPEKVKSEIGEISLDRAGAALGVSRMAMEKSYQDTAPLLKKVIENSDEAAWNEIKKKVEATCEHVGYALSALEKQDGFLDSVRQQVEKGKKLLLKPNLVSVEDIEPYTHSLIPGTIANTHWAFVAAVMRWFHDKGDIRYDQMSMGEAASNSLVKAAKYTCIKKTGRAVTPEATYEGKSDDFYGGWGFYFVRRYLSETPGLAPDEDPMSGLEESMAGTFVPPGKAAGRLMVYDLNRISDDPSRGREIALPDGENFKSIIIHKVIVGGDPADPEDLALYPGCVLVNLPKLKVHSNAMFTNAIKNLGIGLYPLQANCPNCKTWAYATPSSDIPTIKSRIPHQVWVPDLDSETLIPKKDENGVYRVTKTGGLTGTMLDIIRAVDSQDIMMMHVVDAIECVNRDHQGTGLGVSSPEGLVIAGKDVVAVDLLCARYIFSNVGLKESQDAGLDDGFGGFFPQLVPIPELDGKMIRTGKGYDCVMARDYSIARAKAYGLGQTDYQIHGWDCVSENPLASFGGRLGYVNGDTFTDIHTGTLYWDMYKMPWDLQQTFFSYLDAADQLEGSTRKQDFLAAFDETGDNTVTYEENGKKGVFGPALYLGGLYINATGSSDENERFRTFFSLIANPIRCIDPAWNADGHHYNREFFMGSVSVIAQMMSSMNMEVPDRFFPELKWGKGTWPSFSQAMNTYLHQVIYGFKFPKQVGIFSLLGMAIAFADQKFNNRQFVGNVYSAPNPKAPQLYFEALKNKEIEPFDFTFFVPEGFGAGGKLPHVQETSDPAKVLTVEFDQGRIQWPDARGGK